MIVSKKEYDSDMDKLIRRIDELEYAINKLCPHEDFDYHEDVGYIKVCRVCGFRERYYSYNLEYFYEMSKKQELKDKKKIFNNLKVDIKNLEAK